MSAQRAGSAVEASHRSFLPNLPGAPWWGALILAIGSTVIGYAIDAGSGHKELTHVFAGLYIAGCVAAVLAVRQDGVFTAVIQPPLILFCAVPGAYWLFHGRKVGHLKDLLINCGYPLIERFPLMLGTAGAVLLIGLVRWYFGMSRRTAAATTDEDAGTPNDSRMKSFADGLVAKLQSVMRRHLKEDDADEAPAAEERRARRQRRSADARRAARSGRSGARTSRAHSRRARSPREDLQDERPRRRSQATSRDIDPADRPRSARRPRPEGDFEAWAPPPRDARREPRPRRSSYERPAPRSSRFEGFDGYGDRYDHPPERVNRYEPYERQGRRAATRGTNGAGPTHHPISQVRYRGAPSLDEPRAERPSRPRASGRAGGRSAQSWEYDG